MARGSKAKYTDKQKRKAEHIEDAYERRGIAREEAERRAWATVNAESGGGKKSGSGRGKAESGHVAGRATAKRPAAARSASARKAAARQKRKS